MAAMAQDGILTILINSYEEITLMLQYLFRVELIRMIYRITSALKWKRILFLI